LTAGVSFEPELKRPLVLVGRCKVSDLGFGRGGDSPPPKNLTVNILNKEIENELPIGQQRRDNQWLISSNVDPDGSIL